MRTRYIVAESGQIDAMLNLATAILENPPAEDDAEKAFIAIEVMREEFLPGGDGVSPFLSHRREILTHDDLSNLVLHLWNHRNPVCVGQLFWDGDKRTKRITLDLIASYASLGESDPDFMRLADEIRDMRAAEPRKPELVD